MRMLNYVTTSSNPFHHDHRKMKKPVAQRPRYDESVADRRSVSPTFRDNSSRFTSTSSFSSSQGNGSSRFQTSPVPDIDQTWIKRRMERDETFSVGSSSFSKSSRDQPESYAIPTCTMSAFSMYKKPVQTSGISRSKILLPKPSLIPRHKSSSMSQNVTSFARIEDMDFMDASSTSIFSSDISYASSFTDMDGVSFSGEEQTASTSSSDSSHIDAHGFSDSAKKFNENKKKVDSEEERTQSTSEFTIQDQSGSVGFDNQSDSSNNISKLEFVTKGKFSGMTLAETLFLRRNIADGSVVKSDASPVKENERSKVLPTLPQFQQESERVKSIDSVSHLSFAESDQQLCHPLSLKPDTSKLHLVQKSPPAKHNRDNQAPFPTSNRRNTQKEESSPNRNNASEDMAQNTGKSDKMVGKNGKIHNIDAAMKVRRLIENAKKNSQSNQSHIGELSDFLLVRTKLKKSSYNISNGDSKPGVGDDRNEEKVNMKELDSKKMTPLPEVLKSTHQQDNSELIATPPNSDVDVLASKFIDPAISFEESEDENSLLSNDVKLIDMQKIHESLNSLVPLDSTKSDSSEYLDDDTISLPNTADILEGISFDSDEGFSHSGNSCDKESSLILNTSSQSEGIEVCFPEPCESNNDRDAVPKSEERGEVRGLSDSTTEHVVQEIEDSIASNKNDSSKMSCEAPSKSVITTSNQDSIQMTKMGNNREALSLAIQRRGIQNKLKRDQERDGASSDTDEANVDVTKASSSKAPDVELTPTTIETDCSKYSKMLKMGLPRGAVENAMRRDGVDPSLLDGEQNNKVSQTIPVTKKVNTDKFRRTRLHWIEVPDGKHNSIWCRVKDDYDVGQVTIDEQEFKTLFQAMKQMNNPPARVKESASESAVKVIDAKRANNGGIILARLKMSYDDIAKAIDKIDESHFNVEQIQGIIEYIPTAEEQKSLEALSDNKQNLCECEKFMVSIKSVSDAKRKMQCMLFKLTFHTSVGEIKGELSTMLKACDELVKSVRLRKVLGVILKVGNRLNSAGLEQNTKCEVHGFTIDTLVKLNLIKAFDKKTTLLCYIVSLIKRMNESLLEIKSDLPSVFKAQQINLDHDLSLRSLHNQLADVKKLAFQEAAKAKAASGLNTENFGDDTLLKSCKVGVFTLEAEKIMSSLDSANIEVSKRFSMVLEYFAQDEDMKRSELFTIITQFCNDIDVVLAQLNRKNTVKRRFVHRNTRGNDSQKKLTQSEGRQKSKAKDKEPPRWPAPDNE